MTPTALHCVHERPKGTRGVAGCTWSCPCNRLAWRPSSQQPGFGGLAGLDGTGARQIFPMSEPGDGCMDGTNPWNFFFVAVRSHLPGLLIYLPHFLTYPLASFSYSLISLSSSLISPRCKPSSLVQPTSPCTTDNPPTHALCLFSARPPVAFARGRDTCIHPTLPRFATCSNPPPNMVEKLYVTYNDVCIPYTP